MEERSTPTEVDPPTDVPYRSRRRRRAPAEEDEPAEVPAKERTETSTAVSEELPADEPDRGTPALSVDSSPLVLEVPDELPERAALLRRAPAVVPEPVEEPDSGSLGEDSVP